MATAAALLAPESKFEWRMMLGLPPVRKHDCRPLEAVFLLLRARSTAGQLLLYISDLLRITGLISMRVCFTQLLLVELELVIAEHSGRLFAIVGGSHGVFLVFKCRLQPSIAAAVSLF